MPVLHIFNFPKGKFVLGILHIKKEACPMNK